MKCEKCKNETESPTGLCYECWFKSGSPAHKIAEKKCNQCEKNNATEKDVMGFPICSDCRKSEAIEKINRRTI